MIIFFYGLYVLITPANWSWTWFLIALTLQFIGLMAYSGAGRIYYSDAKDDDQWRGGPYA